MSNVLNRTTKEYLTSVNTSLYPTANWIINPDLSAVTGVPSRYWKITGDNVTVMSDEEKAVVDYPLLSGLVIVYDPSDSIVAGRITLVIPNTLLINFDGVANVMQDPVLPNTAFKYMKHSGSSLVEMSKSEKDIVDAYIPVDRDRQLIINDIYLNSSSAEQMARLVSAIDPRVSLILALDDHNYPLARDIIVDMYDKDSNFLVDDLLLANKYFQQSILTI